MESGSDIRGRHANTVRTGSGPTINALLVTRTIVVLLPLCVYMAYLIATQADEEEAQARALVESVAADAAAWTRHELRKTEALLRTIADRPQVRAVDPDRCDPFLPGALSLLPEYTNIAVLTTGGEFVCAAVGWDPAQRVPLHAGIRAATAGRFGLSEPYTGPLSNAYVVGANYPVRDTSGAVRGVLNMPIRLAGLRLADEPATLPQGARTRLLDAAGVVLASSIPGESLGKTAAATDIPDAVWEKRDGSAQATGRDGIPRVYASAHVDGNGWRVIADIDAARLLAGGRARIAWSIALAAAALAAAALSGAIVARRIVRPLRALQAAVEASRPGAYVHAAVDGPHEVRQLGRRFNLMIDEVLSAGRSVEASNARQRELSLALLETEDRERQRIGRDIHDHVGGNFSAMQLNLTRIAHRLDQGDVAALRTLVDDLREIVAATSGEIRAAISELRPPGLEDFGLAAALRSYATHTVARMGARLAFRADDDLPRLRPLLETALFRIAQEALTNIGKHASASVVDIRICVHDDELMLEIDDDGAGFDAARHPGSGNGLRNMRERADAVGARLEIESSPGGGTLVTVCAPLRPHE